MASGCDGEAPTLSRDVWYFGIHLPRGEALRLAGLLYLCKRANPPPEKALAYPGKLTPTHHTPIQLWGSQSHQSGVSSREKTCHASEPCIWQSSRLRLSQASGRKFSAHLPSEVSLSRNSSATACRSALCSCWSCLSLSLAWRRICIADDVDYLCRRQSVKRARHDVALRACCSQVACNSHLTLTCPRQIVT